MKHLWLGPIAGLVSLAACASAPPTQVAPSVPGPMNAISASAPSAAARATPPTLAPSSAASAEVAAPPREGAPGSTRGTVSCGKTRCKVGSEVCTWLADNAVWACQPESDQLDGSYACDDASDCAAPLTCCRLFASAAEYFACKKPDDDCAALPCAEPDGTACPTGQRCADGYCSAEARATCQGGKRCSAAKPYCAWSSSPECVGGAIAALDTNALLQERTPVTGVYECTQPSDCGSEHCCTSMLLAERQTHCAHACDLANSMTLCKSAADCASLTLLLCNGDPHCRRRARCAPPETEKPGSVPPWLKVCSAD